MAIPNTGSPTVTVPDWEIVGPQIAGEIERQSSQLLAEAGTDYDAFERLRARAVRAYGRADPAVCVLAGALAGYLVLVITGRQFLSLAAARPGLGLTPLFLAILAAGLGVRWTLWRRRRRALMRSVSEAYQRWTSVLRDQVLRPFIVEKRNDEVRNPRLFDTSIGEKSPPRLIEGSEPLRLVVTEAMTQLSVTARNVHSGSLGVSGPRGVGKSTILQFFGADAGSDEGRDLRLVVSAPVDYEAREFIIHLFSRLCEAVPHGPADQSAIAAETRGHLEQLRYLRTYTTTWSASLAPRSFLALTRGNAKQRAEQPVALPELVDTFRGYSGRVASWQRSAHGGEGRVVIGIDEVDKIRDSDRAEAFLNDIKAIFGTPGCLYLVSLSEDAMAGFARRTPSIRTAFDSAFDELVPVGPMTYRHSEQLLVKRVTGVPRPFIALCVTGISPDSGSTTGGTTVSITGTGLADATLVTFGGVAGRTKADSNTQITVISPPGTGTVTVTVTTTAGTSQATAVSQYTYTAAPPTVTGISPDGGSTAGGTTVSITGTGLADATRVTFGGVAARITTESNTQITVISPPGAGTVTVTVTTTAGTSQATAASHYAYTARPKRTQSISFTAPTSGTAGGSAALPAKGGGSGNPVVFSVDSDSGPGVCTVSGSTVIYAMAGSCVIDANQPGNATYAAAPQVQQTITVGEKLQLVSFDAPSSGTVGGSASVSATASSGLPVTLMVDSASAGVCTLSGSASGSAVTYTAAGSCVIDAIQAGNATYAAAQARQTIAVSQPS